MGSLPLGTGIFLIASPTLRDPNFSRTVVLLCEHDEQGPVQREIVVVLHRGAPGIEGARPIADGLALGGDQEALLEFLRGPGSAAEGVRVYSGYAGWGAGQLEDEMQAKSWITCPARASFVFAADPSLVWGEVLRSLGPRYAYLARVPLDPRVN